MPPKVSAKKGGKAQKAITKDGAKKKKPRRKESYAIYIYKVISIRFYDIGIYGSLRYLLSYFLFASEASL